MAAAAVAASAVGGIMQAFGQSKADEGETEALKINKDYYEEQARQSLLSSQREIEIFTHDTDDLLGRQISSFGRAGVTLEGSPILTILQTRDRRDKQITAIKQFGEQNQMVALMRAKQTQANSDALNEAGIWRFMGTLLGAGGSAASAYSTVPDNSTVRPATAGTGYTRDSGAGTYYGGTNTAGSASAGKGLGF